MKKLLSLITITSMLAAAPIALADDEITVKIDGNPIEFDVQPTIINERTMVPMRAIFENLGATVDWDDETKTAWGDMSGITISFKLNDPNMMKNTIAIPIDSPATVIDGRTLLPVRAVAESFGMNVSWDGYSKTVFIDSTNNLESFTYGNMLYKGEVVNGLAHGYGSCWNTETNELEFTGLWENGAKSKGSFYFYDGSIFSGTFSDGKMTNGILQYSDGNLYTGDFKDSIPNGTGTMYYTNGDIYEGSWGNGTWNGWGKLYFSYYDVTYEGVFLNGKKNGNFTIYDHAFGDTYQGNYDNDQPIMK